MELDIGTVVRWILGCFFVGLVGRLLRRFFSGAVYRGKLGDLGGCVAVVTGGGGGLGQALVRALVKQGCTVIIGDIDDCQQLTTELNQTLATTKVQYIPLDLSNLESIQNFSKALPVKKIDFLINNAGVMGLPTLVKTKSGYEAHHGINYMGHFYLTHLLWDKLNQAEQFRIVNVSSITHRRVMGFGRRTQLGKFNLEEDGVYDRDLAYARSKLFLTMFARTLNEKIKEGRGAAFSVHPGIVRSNITRYMFAGRWKSFLFKIIYPLHWLMTKSCDQGIQTILHVLYTDLKDLEPGAFYSDCAVSHSNPLVQVHHRKIFQLAQQSLGIQFGE